MEKCGQTENGGNAKLLSSIKEKVSVTEKTAANSLRDKNICGERGKYWVKAPAKNK